MTPLTVIALFHQIIFYNSEYHGSQASINEECNDANAQPGNSGNAPACVACYYDSTTTNFFQLAALKVRSVKMKEEEEKKRGDNNLT